MTLILLAAWIAGMPLAAFAEGLTNAPGSQPTPTKLALIMAWPVAVVVLVYLLIVGASHRLGGLIRDAWIARMIRATAEAKEPAERPKAPEATQNCVGGVSDSEAA